jgi:hypothetical protein
VPVPTHPPQPGNRLSHLHLHCTLLALQTCGSTPTFIRLLPTGSNHALLFFFIVITIFRLSTCTRSFTMVLGLRASYHPAQSARHESYQSPLVCPCAACFDGEERRQTREACENPAKEVGGAVAKAPAVLKRAESSRWQKFGIPLGRRQSATSTASARPLRAVAQEMPQGQDSWA